MFYKSFGSIEGVLQKRNGNFYIVDDLTGLDIKIFFLKNKDFLLNNRVIASGLILSNKSGKKIFGIIEAIEEIPEEQFLPTIDEMIGIL